MAKKSKMKWDLAGSVKFAKALASQDGLSIRMHERDNFQPYSQNGVIHMSPPTPTNMKVYEPELHKCISHNFKEVAFTQEQEYEDESRSQITHRLLTDYIAEKAKHGEYPGRDDILSAHRSAVMSSFDYDSIPDKGLQELLHTLTQARNEWQDYVHDDTETSLEKKKSKGGQSFIDALNACDSKQKLQELVQLVEDVAQEEQDQKQGGDDSQGKKGEKQDGQGTDGDGSGEAESDGDSGSGDDGNEDGSGSGSPSDGEAGGEDGEEGDSASDGSDSGDSGSGEGDEGSDSGSQGSPEAGDAGKGDSEGTSDQGGDSESSEEGARGLGFSASKALEGANILGKSVRGDVKSVDRATDYIPAPVSNDKVVIPNINRVDSRTTHHINKLLDQLNLSKAVKRSLLSMKQVGYEYGLRRGKVNSKAISRIYTNTNGQPRIFKQRNSSRLEIESAVTILCDCSGSMSGSKYLYASASCISISLILQDLRIPHEVVGFTTEYSGNIYYPFKSYGETILSRDKLVARFASDTISMNANSDGEAVVYCMESLMRRKEKSKVLLVLSDGYPAGNGRGDSHAFLKSITSTIEDEGVVNLAAIGIEDSSVRKFYKNYQIVKKAQDLEPALLSVMKKNIIR